MNVRTHEDYTHQDYMLRHMRRMRRVLSKSGVKLYLHRNGGGYTLYLDGDDWRGEHACHLDTMRELEEAVQDIDERRDCDMPITHYFGY